MSTVTVVATVEASNNPPRVRLDVTDIGTPNLFAVTVTRLNPDGRLVPVRTADGNPLTLTTSGVTRVGTVYDPEVPYGEIVQYSTVEDPTSSSGEVTVPAAQAWLNHPGVPELSQPVEFRVGSFQDEEFSVNQSVFYPMGRATPLVISDGTRHSGRSSFTVSTETPAALMAIRSLVSDAGTLLLNVSPALGLGIETNYIAISDVTVSRPSTVGSDPLRDIRMTYTVVDRPSGGTTAERTYIDLLNYAAYSELLAAYPTYSDLLAGP